MNKVIAGKYEGKSIMVTKGKVLIVTSPFSPLELSGENISNYEVITEEHRKSAKSGVARGLVGGALIGPVGMLAGGISAKSKGTYQIAIEFNDGDRSLIEIESKVYKLFVKQMFENGYIKNEHTSISPKTTESSGKSFGKFIKRFIGGIVVIVIVSIVIQLISGEEVFIKSDGTQQIEYNILGEKSVNGLEGKCYRVGIEEPSDMNINDIALSLLGKYNTEDLEELKIYIYKQGHIIENMDEMFVGSKYELNLTKEANGYSYYLWDVIEDSEIEKGILDL